MVITCVDSNGQVTDLTDWTAYAQVRPTPGGTVLYNLNPLIPLGTDGKIYIEISAAVNGSFATGDYFWDLILEDPNGTRFGPYISGEFDVKLPITQPGT